MTLVAAVSASFAACADTSRPVAVIPTWPVSPERLAAATTALPAEFGSASWALDPAYPAPSPDSTVLHILVWELACSGGAPATGRMSAPVVVAAADSVTITIGVSALDVPPGALLTCPGPPGTPAILTLSEPLGRRTLLDGGSTPPAPPSPARG